MSDGSVVYISKLNMHMDVNYNYTAEEIKNTSKFPLLPSLRPSPPLPPTPHLASTFPSLVDECGAATTSPIFSTLISVTVGVLYLILYPQMVASVPAQSLNSFPLLTFHANKTVNVLTTLLFCSLRFSALLYPLVRLEAFVFSWKGLCLVERFVCSQRHDLLAYPPLAIFSIFYHIVQTFHSPHTFQLLYVHFIYILLKISVSPFFLLVLQSFFSIMFGMTSLAWLLRRLKVIIESVSFLN